MLGEQIGKYKIISCIGRGGMADVYKALHPELDRVVALKVLNRALVHSPEMLERFRREARAIAALRHPNIVQVFDLDVIDNIYFMVMEFVEGETLSQRLSRLRQNNERMTFDEIMYVITAVGNALHYAHEQGMLHRDIKPSNIMFRDDGSVVLTDFGVAKILNASSEITASGAVAGTPAYMAPEQWTTDAPDRRSDIYSLGVVLYQMVTGRLPFNADTPGRLMFQHISEPPPLPRKISPGTPLELERVILRAMAKDPSDRYQTAQALVQDLRDVIYQIERTAPTGIFSKPVHSGKGAKAAQQEDSSERRRWPLLGLGLGVLVIVVGVLGVFLGGLVGSDDPQGTPDVTATAVAIRLATLEATLSATPATVTPQTSLPPAATATMPGPTAPPVRVSPTATLQLSPVPSPTLTPTPDDVACVAQMTLLEDVNYLNTNWWGTVNAGFEKVWRLGNTGQCAWPEGTVLVHLDGQNFGLDQPFEVGALAPGQDVRLVLPLRLPSQPDQYKGRFELQTPAGESIGEPLSVQAEARPFATATPVVEPGQPLEIVGWELIGWRNLTQENVWRGTVRLHAQGGVGNYVWYQDTLDGPPLAGNTLTFEWGGGRDFFGSVWVVSGDQVDHQDLHIPYPGGN